MDWNDYFYRFAETAALKSKDSTKVGAVLVGPVNEVRLTGFNGPPRGVIDSPEKRERPAKYLYASHAEANLIAFAARAGIQTEGCKVVVTHAPCAACARTMIQAGIVEVVIGHGEFASSTTWDAENSAAHQMFNEAGVKVTQLEAK